MHPGADGEAVRAHGQRLAAARAAAAARGVDALLITPGANLRYLTGCPLELATRLTCLVAPVGGEPLLVVPELERAAVEAVVAPEVAVAGWPDGADPYALVAAHLGRVRRVAVDDRMVAEQVFGLRAALPDAEQVLAGAVLRALRTRKSPGEVASLRRAAAAIDAVHARVGELLRPGRSEAAVARDLADAMIAAGHLTVDFVIVGSGPNGADPHHDAGPRRVARAEPVVIDVGGRMPDGYHSDCTRVYSCGKPPAAVRDAYAVLRRAQQAAFAAVRPGVPCMEVDARARAVLAEAGLTERFIHRTGHGLGLEEHEDPFIVAGNAQTLEPGMVFSIEPGVYFHGRFGLRLEDIVVCTPDGAERLNARDRDIAVLGF